jgi:hypothetical protein
VSNASAYHEVLVNQIIAIVRSTLPKARLYLATISVDGEEVNNINHPRIDEYAVAMATAGNATNVPVVDLRHRYLAYETANNCMNAHGGLLTGAGVHRTHRRAR